MLIIYNQELEPLGLIEKISLFTWRRVFSGVGVFSLQVPLTKEHLNLLQKNRLIIINHEARPEAAEIGFIRTWQNIDGSEEMEVRGKFITAWLGKRVILNPIMANLDTVSIITRIVNENIINPQDPNRIIPFPGAPLILQRDSEQRTHIDYISEPLENCLDACIELAAIPDINIPGKIGLCIFPDLTKRQFIFKIQSGRDLTDCTVFGQDFDNIRDMEYITDNANFKSTAYVGVEATDHNPRVIVETSGSYTGLNRAEVFIQASDIVREDSPKMHNQLISRGSQKLLTFKETLAFTAKINPKSYPRYRQDYDLGDFVTFINKSRNIIIKLQITEITETYTSSGMPEIELCFGENPPGIASQIRILLLNNGG